MVIGTHTHSIGNECWNVVEGRQYFLTAILYPILYFQLHQMFAMHFCTHVQVIKFSNMFTIIGQNDPRINQSIDCLALCTEYLTKANVFGSNLGNSG